VPRVFTLPAHPDDDHLFNLAVEAKAAYLVTWETRLLALEAATSPDARRLRELAPQLRILTPAALAQELSVRDA
jgi:predicted nucleic acid-binding protein